VTALGDARQAVADLLADATGEQAFGYLPSAIYPPCWVIDAGSPYLTPDGPLGGAKVHFEAIFIAANAVGNSIVTDAADTAIERGAAALFEAGYEVGNVGFVKETLNGGAYLAGVVQLSTPVSLAAVAPIFILGGTSFTGITAIEFDNDAAGFDASFADMSAQYFFSITAQQATAADSFWSFCAEHVGQVIEYDYAPGGNVAPSADKPHITGSVEIAPVPELSTALGATFAVRLDCEQAPTIVRGA
jgi:hypothetical protein